MQIGLIELFGMEEIKQYINLQMRKMLEIFEKIIKFDIFFQEKEFKKSKSIFSYIVFIFLSVGSYISIFPERLVINTNLLSNPKTILFILLIYISYITSFFNLVLLHQKINIIIHHNLFYTDICDIFYILVYLSKIHPQFGHKHDVSIIIMM